MWKEECFVNLYFLDLEDVENASYFLNQLSMLICNFASRTYLSEYTGKIYDMAIDPYHCKTIQEKLNTKDVKVINKIYYEVMCNFTELMVHPYGNYVCQKLMDVVDDNLKVNILNICKYHLVDMSNNIHGTRCVQKLIIISDKYSVFEEVFKDHVVSMIHNIYGNHVIRTCVEKMGTKNQFVYDAIVKNCIEVSNNIYGCCVFKYCFGLATDKQKTQLMNAVDVNAIDLISNPYGNYAIQTVLDSNTDPNFPTKIIKKSVGKIYQFSIEKHNSNVIEKCIKQGNAECVKRVMNELLFFSTDKKKVRNSLLNLIYDSYGNYVIKMCLTESLKKSRLEYCSMLEILYPIWYKFKRYPHTKIINEHFRVYSLGIYDKI
jgi:pumilio RNA-binding family